MTDKQNNKKPIAFPHDALFKRSLQEVGMARDFFKHHLPKAILKDIDLTSLQLQPSSFIKNEGHNLFSDIVYRTKIRNKPGYLFCLLEHQSTPDRWMALRMNSYLMNFFEQQLRQKCRALPSAFCCVFYHGKPSPYPYSLDFFDLFEDPHWARNNIFQPFHLVDVTQTPDEEILQHGDIATFELLQKHIWARDIGIALNKLREAGCLQVVAAQYGDLFKFVIEYTLQKGESPDQSQVIDQLCQALPQHQDSIMSIAQQLREEGMQLGLEQGMQLGLEQGMDQGMQRGMDQGIKQGISQGLKQGISQGLKQGMQRGIEYIALKLIQSGQNEQSIAHMTGLSLKRIDELKTQVTQQPEYNEID